MSLTPAAPRTKFRNHADHAVHHIFTMADDRDYVRPGVPTRQPTIVVLKGCHQVRRVKRNYCEYCFFCSFLLLSLHVALCLISRRMPSSHALCWLLSLTCVLSFLSLYLTLCLTSTDGCFVFFALCLFCRWLSSLSFSCALSLSSFRVSLCYRRHHLCCHSFIMLIILVVMVMVLIAVFLYFVCIYFFLRPLSLASSSLSLSCASSLFVYVLLTVVADILFCHYEMLVLSMCWQLLILTRVV